MMNRRLLIHVEQTAADLGSFSIYAVASLFLFQFQFSTASPYEGPTVSTSIDQEAVFPLPGNDDVPTTSEVPVAFFICSLAIILFELLDFTTKRIGIWLGCKEIPVRGKHLDEFRTIDQLYLAFSKANTGPFTYLFFRYLWLSESFFWDWRKMTLANALLPIPLLYIAFDATYSLLHWVLHWQSLYPYIHKHHHVQKAPSRGSVDAANVHPIEMFLGEYNHLLAVYVVTSALTRVHVVAPIVFLVLGGVVAGVNHTRHDLSVKVPMPTRTGWSTVTLFDSKAHDVHHRIPQSNYGQYTMFWDILFGTYRPYDPNDRVNPDAQLDPKTGRTKRGGMVKSE